MFIKLYTVQACDICGGGAGYYSGMLPQYHKHYIGLRWRFSAFQSDLGHETEGTAAFSKDYYHSWELMGRFYPHRRVQLLAFLPLNYNMQTSPSGDYHLVGLGDMSVMGLYNIYNTSFLGEKDTKHNLLAGVGVKVPTGTFRNKDNQGNLLPVGFQLGTGSVDILVTAIYTLRHKRWGLNNSVTYKINTPNADTYKFGNQLTASTTAFFLHQIKDKNWGLMPKLGLQFEHANYNLKNEYKRINTGGNQLVASTGLEIYYKKIQMGFDFQLPIWQNLSSGLVYAQPRCMVYINYLF